MGVELLVDSTENDSIANSWNPQLTNSARLLLLWKAN